MNDDLRTFYRLVQRTRSGVFAWLDTLPPAVLTTPHRDFAFGSLAGIYAHVADCYLLWVGAVGLGRGPVPPVDAGSVRALRDAFATVDAAVDEALEVFTDLDAPLTRTTPDGGREVTSRRWLLLHPITHEFHHKGQALALARVLGHPHPGAPDADLVPPA
jgi:uncharacterized damage-inducible protein DinB